jgi:hypothetical protein
MGCTLISSNADAENSVATGVLMQLLMLSTVPSAAEVADSKAIKLTKAAAGAQQGCLEPCWCPVGPIGCMPPPPPCVFQSKTMPSASGC